MSLLLDCVSTGRKALRRVLSRRGAAVLKALWADYSFRNFKRRIAKHHYGPYEFQIEIVDFDGASWYDHDSDESAVAEISILKKHKLVPGAKVFNAGANQCIQAMMMAQEVGPNGYVWAIEPNHHNVCAGQRNCELNGVHNLEVIEAAVSSSSGQVWFDRSMNGQVAISEADYGAHPVQAVTIDDLSASVGVPDVLFIDVEGFECEVLKGARATLDLYRPDCFVEVHRQMGLERFGGSLQEVTSFFTPAVYDLFYKGGNGGVFRRVINLCELPKTRFYLIAVSKD